MFNRKEARASLAGLGLLVLVHLGAEWWRSLQERPLPIIVPIATTWYPFESPKKEFKNPYRRYNRGSTFRPRHFKNPLIYPKPGTMADSLGVQDWENLGLSPKQVQWAEIIRKERGGLKNAEDIDRLFMLKEPQRETLKQLLVFPVDSTEKIEFKVNNKPPTGFREKVPLNSADSLELLSVQGLGGFTVRQILSHRRTFGAFVSLGELYYLKGMQPERYEKLRGQLFLDSAAVEPVQWHYLGRTQLLALSFIDWKMAKSLLALRKKQGGNLPSKAQCIQAGMNDRQEAGSTNTVQFTDQTLSHAKLLIAGLREPGPRPMR